RPAVANIANMSTGDPRTSRAAIHGILFFAALVSVNVAFPSLLWPWYLVLPLFVYGAIVLAVGPLRRSIPKLAVGRLDGWPLLCAVAIVATTAGVLVAFQMLVRPDVQDLAAKLLLDWFDGLLLAGVFFSVANAVLEELIFRGVLWEVVSEEWNQGTALG